MRYGKISGIDLNVPRLIFGCATEAMIRGENVNALLDAAVDQGYTAFDTAENYGQSEVCLGNWLKEHKNRSRIVLITKGCHPYDGKSRVTPKDLKADLEQSLRCLQTDYIDLYLMHRDDHTIPAGEVVEILNEEVRKGTIRAFGGSNWTVGRIREAGEYAEKHQLHPFAASSPNYSLAHQAADPFGGGDGCVTLTGPEHAADRKWYEETGLPILAYSSLARGFLSGRIKSNAPQEASALLDEYARRGFDYPENYERLRRAEELSREMGCTVSQLALAWTLSQKLNVYPIVSINKEKRLQENLKALDLQLSERDVKWLNLELDNR